MGLSGLQLVESEPRSSLPGRPGADQPREEPAGGPLALIRQGHRRDEDVGFWWWLLGASGADWFPDALRPNCASDFEIYSLIKSPSRPPLLLHWTAILIHWDSFPRRLSDMQEGDLSGLRGGFCSIEYLLSFLRGFECHYMTAETLNSTGNPLLPFLSFSLGGGEFFVCPNILLLKNIKKSTWSYGCILNHTFFL